MGGRWGAACVQCTAEVSIFHFAIFGDAGRGGETYVQTWKRDNIDVVIDTCMLSRFFKPVRRWRREGCLGGLGIWLGMCR